MNSESSVPINLIDLADQTVLVTGASSGIGRATSILLSRLGARLVISGRNAEELERTSAELVGHHHVIAPFDLQNVERIGEWMTSVVAAAGPVHGLVHCAGILVTRPLKFVTTENYDETMRVNVGAAVELSKGLRHRAVRAPQGSVVFVSSIMGLVGQSGLAAYSTSKGALVALTRTLALEFASDGVRFNCVSPGLVNTEMAARLKKSLPSGKYEAIEQSHPLGVGTPEDVAHAIAFLLSSAARWITGTTLVVDGGYTAQ